MKRSTPLNIKRVRNQKRNESIEREGESTIGGHLSSFAKDTSQSISGAFTDIGKGIFEQFIPTSKQETKDEFSPETLAELEEQGQSKKINKERGNLFNYRTIEESRQLQEIQSRIQEIKEQTKAIRRANQEFVSDVDRIDKVVDQINPSEERNEYTIHFLGLILEQLKLMLKKVKEIGSSETWKEAMQTKKAKRGSLFAARAKKKGTQYSKSKELSITRQTQ